MLNYYDSVYENLLGKSGCPNIFLRRQRTLCVAVYMNKIFKLRNIDRLICRKYEANLKIPNPNQVNFGGAVI